MAATRTRKPNLPKAKIDFDLLFSGIEQPEIVIASDEEKPIEKSPSKFCLESSLAACKLNSK